MTKAYPRNKNATRQANRLAASEAGRRFGAGLIRTVLVGSVLAWWALLPGCGVQPPSPQGTSPSGSPLSVSGISADELFEIAVDNLEHLEKYQSGQMLQQVVERLNQWIKFQHRPTAWQPDVLIRRLPKAYQQLPSVQEADKLEFSPEDGYVLLAALWARDLAKWVAGQTTDELQQAQRLFDWTVRNIQLPAAGDPWGPGWRQLPWETLLLGRGSSLDRAWVFILLARQLGLEAFLIALSPAEPQDSASEVPWAVGLLQGKQIYVFDPALGLPIPGPDGIRQAAQSGLEIRPATFRQLADNPLLLRQLDLDPTERYPVVSGDLNRAVALIAALPAELSVRMPMVESRLVGGGRMSLAVRASELADRIKAAAGFREVKLWTRPFAIELERLQQGQDPQFIRQRALALAPFELGATAALWRGRVAHLRGNLSGERGAAYFYHQARPPESELNIAVAEGKLPLPIRDLFLRAKQDASYWLGLVCFELGQYQAALDYFQKRCLEPWPDGPWQTGAAYNLGRTYEALGQYEQALRYYVDQPHAPDSYGRRLRARWIKEHLMSSGQPAGQPTEKPPASAKPSEKPSASANRTDQPSGLPEPAQKPSAPSEPDEKRSDSSHPAKSPRTLPNSPESRRLLQTSQSLGLAARMEPTSEQPGKPPASAKPSEKPAPAALPNR